MTTLSDNEDEEDAEVEGDDGTGGDDDSVEEPRKPVVKKASTSAAARRRSSASTPLAPKLERSPSVLSNSVSEAVSRVFPSFASHADPPRSRPVWATALLLPQHRRGRAATSTAAATSNTAASATTATPASAAAAATSHLFFAPRKPLHPATRLPESLPPTRIHERHRPSSLGLPAWRLVPTSAVDVRRPRDVASPNPTSAPSPADQPPSPRLERLHVSPPTTPIHPAVPSRAPTPTPGPGPGPAAPVLDAGRQRHRVPRDRVRDAPAPVSPATESAAARVLPVRWTRDAFCARVQSDAPVRHAPTRASGNGSEQRVQQQRRFCGAYAAAAHGGRGAEGRPDAAAAGVGRALEEQLARGEERLAEAAVERVDSVGGEESGRRRRWGRGAHHRSSFGASSAGARGHAGGANLHR